LAGLFCALKLAPRPVTVVTAAPIGEGASSARAQAASPRSAPTIDRYACRDTVAWRGIVDRHIAELIARGSGAHRGFVRYGVPFDRDKEGRFLLSRGAAIRAAASCVQGDRAGAAIMAALIAAVRKTPTVRVLEGVVMHDLLADGRYVTGIAARPAGRNTEPIAIPARAVVLASGGLGGSMRSPPIRAKRRGGGSPLRRAPAR
jgi:L-aspartate oxidase